MRRSGASLRCVAAPVRPSLRCVAPVRRCVSNAVTPVSNAPVRHAPVRHAPVPGCGTLPEGVPFSEASSRAKRGRPADCEARPFSRAKRGRPAERSERLHRAKRGRAKVIGRSPLQKNSKRFHQKAQGNHLLLSFLFYRGCLIKILFSKKVGAIISILGFFILGYTINFIYIQLYTINSSSY